MSRVFRNGDCPKCVGCSAVGQVHNASRVFRDEAGPQSLGCFVVRFMECGHYFGKAL